MNEAIAFAVTHVKQPALSSKAKAIDRTCQPQPVSKTKSLSSDTTAKLREQINAWVRNEYEDNVSAAARALGVTQTALRDVLKGNRGVGAKVLEAFAETTGRSIDGLLGLPSNDTTEPAWGNLPGYRESERELRATHPHRYSEALYKTGRRIRGAMPLEVPVTVQTLRRLLNFLEETTKVEELADLETERIEKKLAADIKRADTRAKNKAKLSEPELLPKSSK